MDGRNGAVVQRDGQIIVKFLKENTLVMEVQARNTSDAYELMRYWIQTGIIDDSYEQIS